MANKWRNIRVFISSTFRDMHAERDHLVRVVFPELKNLCREKQIHLTDVDLRWGVSESDAQDGKALDICLNEIDSCRPYFLGLLGHRYGWIPDGQNLSITASEIYHGVLHNDLPSQVVDMRGIIEGRFEGRRLRDEQINCLRANYTWDAEKRVYVLRSSLSDDDAEIIRDIFRKYAAYQRDRSFFFFRSERLSRQLARHENDDFFESDPHLADSLEALKREIKDSGIVCFEYDDLEDFGQKVRNELWQHIQVELEEASTEERDPLDVEREMHDLFAADRTRRFIGRADYLNRMRQFCEKPDRGSLLLVTGKPGSGKSSLMARFSEEIQHAHPDWLIIPHFIGASPDSTNLRRSLRRFYAEINRHLELDEVVPEDTRELLNGFSDKLNQAAQANRVLFVIDAVNQMEKADTPQDMTWLPVNPPENVFWVVSTLAGDALDALMNRQPVRVEVRGLDAHEVGRLVDDYLAEVRKAFPSPQIRENFLAKLDSGNPLYIMVALEELRIFGSFEQLAGRIDLLPDDVPALFQQVLERIENDFAAWPGLVADALSVIACSRQGMTPEEMQTLLAEYAPTREPINLPQHPPKGLFSRVLNFFKRHPGPKAPPIPAVPDKLPDMVWSRLRLSLDAYLFERSGAVDFFHGQLKEAVGARYLSTDAERDRWHQTIADYFENRWAEPYPRALDELPHQLAKAKDWDGVERVLCDLLFVQEKCAAGLTYDLIADYHTALENLPENQINIEEEKDRQARLDKYAQDLVAVAKGELAIADLEVIPSVEPKGDACFEAELERITTRPTRLDRVQCFANFVQGQSHHLIKYGSEPRFCLRQAFNHADGGPVERAASTILRRQARRKLLLRHPSWRPTFNPYPVCLRILEGHTDWVNSVCLSVDGQRAVSASKDHTLRLWDLEQGRCLNTLKGHTDGVLSVCLSADGKRAVSASRDRTLRLWDLEQGRCLKTLQGHTDGVLSVCLSADGQRAVSASDDQTLRLWDLERGRCLRTMHGHTDRVGSVSLSADGQRAVSGSWDQTLRLWDLEQGRCLKTLQGHTGWVNSVCLSADGQRAISASADQTLRLWDLEQGRCLKTLQGLTEWVLSVCLSADGQRAVSASFNDKTLRVWDLERERCLNILQGHTGRVISVCLSADGQRAISASADQTLRLWDLEQGRCLNTLQGHTDPVDSVCLSADGKRAVSASDDKTLRLWDLEQGRCLKTLQGHTDPVESVCLSADGQRAVSGSWDQTLRLWDLEQGRCLKTLQGHTGSVESVCLSADGQRAVSASWDHTLRLWDLERGRCLKTLQGHTKLVSSVCLSADGQRAVSASADQTLRLWDLEQGRCLRTMHGHTDRVGSVSLSADGQRAVSASKDHTLCLWDLEQGRCLKTLQGHTSWVNSVCLSADGQRAVSASADWTLRLWDLEQGRCLKTLQGHTDGVLSVSLTADGQRALSASFDHTLRLWDLEQGRCLAVAAFDAGVSSVALKNDTVVAGFSTGRVEVLSLGGGVIGPA